MRSFPVHMDIIVLGYDDASRKLDGIQCLKATQIPDTSILVCAILYYDNHHYSHYYLLMFYFTSYTLACINIHCS